MSSEQQLEERFIQKLLSLKYEDRPDIRNRAAPRLPSKGDQRVTSYPRMLAVPSILPRLMASIARQCRPKSDTPATYF